LGQQSQKTSQRVSKLDPDLSRDKEGSGSGTESDDKGQLSGVLEHVKSTMLLYLGKIPIIDKNNE